MPPDSSSLIASSSSESLCWALAFCWKAEPREVNVPEASGSLVQRFEAWCRTRAFPCLVDWVPLAPARSVRALFKPVPRVQAVVTAILPSPVELSGPRAASPEWPASQGLVPELAELERHHDAPFWHTLFWVPWKVIPTLDQVESRLARVEANGAGPVLGSLSQLPPGPPALPRDLDHPAAMEIREHENRILARPEYASLQYDRRCFVAQANSANGDVQPGLRFDYHQQDDQIWAWYAGTGVHLGALAARKTSSGALRMAYHHLNDAGELRAGQCLSFPELLPDGRLRMHEFWRWSSADRSAGASQIEESPGITVVRKLS